MQRGIQMQQARAINTKAGDKKRGGKQRRHERKRARGAVALADEVPAEVEEGGGRLSDDEPAKHEGEEVSAAGDEGAEEEDRVVRDGVQLAERGVGGDDVQKVADEVAGEGGVGDDDAGGLRVHVRRREGERRGRGRGRDAELVDGGRVPEAGEVARAARGGEERVQGGDDVGGGVAAHGGGEVGLGEGEGHHRFEEPEESLPEEEGDGEGVEG